MRDGIVQPGKRHLTATGKVWRVGYRRNR